MQNEDKKNKILVSDFYNQNPCLSNSINKETQILKNHIPGYYLNDNNKDFVSKKTNFEDYTNILTKYLSDLNWSPCKNEDNSIVADSGDKRWLIECDFVNSNSSIDSEYVLKVLGRITFYLESPEKRYSIATNSNVLFQQLINQTPNALTEMLNLSYMLIEEKQKLSIVEMKNYFR